MHYDELRKTQFHLWNAESGKGWWLPGGCGYTTMRAEAGVFSLEEAVMQCRKDWRWEKRMDKPWVIMIPAE